MRNNHLDFDHAAKNTCRFQEKMLTDPAIGTLYVRKAVFGGKAPKKVRVTIEWE